jgi:1,2-phenylacetyl-CoA epoxidase catalytic subunit
MSNEALFDPAIEADAAEAAANFVVTLADNKYFLAHRLAEWGVGAPFLESAVACTAIAQEEAGHARGLYSLLEDFPAGLAPVSLEREDARARKYALSYVVESSTSWFRGVAALLLLDRAMTTTLEAVRGSSLAELRKRAVRILGDEPFHARYAEGRLREHARVPEEAEALTRELELLLPETLCWFGPDGEEGVRLLVDTGIVAQDNEALRQEFLDSLMRDALAAGLRLPVESGTGGVWTYPELPWSDWNRLERRLPTAPTTA